MTLDRRFAALPTRHLAGDLIVIEATTLRSRLRGLGGLTTLAPDQALQLPARSVHTFTMRFALDLIWLAGDGRVIRTDRDVPRRRTRTCLAARSVIELRAGGADAFLAGLAAAPSAAPTP